MAAAAIRKLMLPSLGNSHNQDIRMNIYNEMKQNIIINQKFIIITKNNHFSSVLYTIGDGYKIVQNSLSVGC
jgi:hypothetical protein